MEHDPTDPNIRIANGIVADTHRLLVEPYRTQQTTRMRYRHGDYSFELTVDSCIESDELTRSSRYLYIYSSQKHDADLADGDHFLNPHGLVFSLDIGSLARAEISGLLDGFDKLPEIIPAAGELSGWLEMVQKATNQKREEDTVDAQLFGELQVGYAELIEPGFTETVLQKYPKLSNGTFVSLTSKSLHGSLEFAWPNQTLDPLVKVAVRAPDATDQVVFAQTQQGEYETFIQLANEMERIAEYAKPEDVFRNADGKIVGVSISGWDKVAVESAERAMGLRTLKPDCLVVVRQCLDEVLTLGDSTGQTD